MMEEKSWQEFRDTGLFWFINTTLHAFGWALVVEEVRCPDGKGGQVTEITNVYPARVGFRGFSEDINTDGYKKLSKYMKDNAETLDEEANL